MKWIDTLSYLPLLKFSSPFSVLNEYYPDGIGFSTMSMKNGKPDGESGKANVFFKVSLKNTVLQVYKART